MPEAAGAGERQAAQGSGECLTLRVGLRLKAAEVVDVLADLFVARGMPDHIRSANGAELVAKGSTGLDRGGRSEDGIQRVRQPGGKLLCGELQRKLRDNMGITPSIEAAFL